MLVHPEQEGLVLGLPALGHPEQEVLALGHPGKEVLALGQPRLEPLALDRPYSDHSESVLALGRFGQQEVDWIRKLVTNRTLTYLAQEPQEPQMAQGGAENRQQML
jgi:hypothetical protein